MKHLSTATRAWIRATIIAGVLAFSGAQAEAKDLVSAPLKGGAGGLLCSCTSLGGEIVVDFALGNDLGATRCNNVSLSGADGCPAAVPTTRRCRVGRSDGRALTTRQIACSFMSLDGAGQPLVVVPVDKRKR